MRLLVCTQAMDLDDPILGFFHRWVEKIAESVESVHVVCLKEGRHTVPATVCVHSLGKESGRSRIKYLIRFYRYIWSLRKEYDLVFVHMNQEYVLLGSLLWRIWGKRIILWRNHKKGSLYTRIACMFAHMVCYTSPEAYVARYLNARQMPIGIDTERFRPVGEARAGSILFLGRLDEVKRLGLFLNTMEFLSNTSEIHADIYGEPTSGREAYVRTLRERYVRLANVSYHPSVPNTDTPAIYASHRVYVNLTPSGSFDKTIGEAMACGCVVVCSNEALRGVIPDALFAGDTPERVAEAIRFGLSISPDKRKNMVSANYAFIEHNHSLNVLTKELISIFSTV